MKKKHFKIIISSFVVGIIILTVAVFADQSSDLAFNKIDQLASTGQLAQKPDIFGSDPNSAIYKPPTGSSANPTINSNNNTPAAGRIEASKAYVEAQKAAGTFGGSIQKQVNSGVVVGGSTTTKGTPSYTPISGIDFSAAKTGQAADSDFIALLRTIFNWGIAAAVILATLAVVVGSVQYMTTDAVYDKTEGKQRIQSAIGGLILALMSWLILFTINENIFSSNFLLKLNNLEEQNKINSANDSGAVGTEEPKKEFTANKNKYDLAMVTADYYSGERNKWEKIISDCFDADGNFIKPPATVNCSTSIKNTKISEIESEISKLAQEEAFLIQEGIGLLEKNKKLSNDSGLDKEIISDKSRLSDLINVLNRETQNNNEVSDNTNTTNNLVPDNSDGNGGNKVSVQDLIDANNQNTTNSTDFESSTSEPNLSDSDLNLLAFQDKAFQNILIENEKADITNLSEGLENTLLIFRDTCCGGRATVNESETYRNSFNVSDIYSEDNSFLIEKSLTNQYGANSWNSLNGLVEKNTYPDQNLVDITEYLNCLDARTRWLKWSCNKPDDYKNISGRYYNTNKKGVLGVDLMESREYLADIKGLNTKVIYEKDSWVVKNI